MLGTEGSQGEIDMQASEADLKEAFASVDGKGSGHGDLFFGIIKEALLSSRTARRKSYESLGNTNYEKTYETQFLSCNGIPAADSKR